MFYGIYLNKTLYLAEESTINQIKVTISENDKFFVCVLSDEGKLICYINDENSFNFKKIDCEENNDSNDQYKDFYFKENNVFMLLSFSQLS